MNSIDAIPTAKAVTAHVISLEDYRKRHKPEQEIPQVKSHAEQIREDRGDLVESIALEIQSVVHASRKNNVGQLLKQDKPSIRMLSLECRLQSIEEQLSSIQAAICKDGGAHE